MSLRSLKSNRIRYKNTLDKELSIGNDLLVKQRLCRCKGFCLEARCMYTKIVKLL